MADTVYIFADSEAGIAYGDLLSPDTDTTVDDASGSLEDVCANSVDVYDVSSTPDANQNDASDATPDASSVEGDAGAICVGAISPDLYESVWGDVAVEDSRAEPQQFPSEQLDRSCSVIRDYCQRVVDKCADINGLPHIPVVIDNGMADVAQSNAGKPLVVGDEVIKINADWIRNQVQDGTKTPEAAVAGAVLHEYGHACLQDQGYGADVASNHHMEIRADIFAAEAMKQMGFDSDAFADLVAPFDGSDTHPSGAERAEIIRSA